MLGKNTWPNKNKLFPTQNKQRTVMYTRTLTPGMFSYNLISWIPTDLPKSLTGSWNHPINNTNPGPQITFLFFGSSVRLGFHSSEICDEGRNGGNKHCSKCLCWSWRNACERLTYTAHTETCIWDLLGEPAYEDSMNDEGEGI